MTAALLQAQLGILVQFGGKKAPVFPGFMWDSAFAHKGEKGESQLFPRNTEHLAPRSGYRELIARHSRLLGGGFWVLT